MRWRVDTTSIAVASSNSRTATWPSGPAPWTCWGRRTARRLATAAICGPKRRLTGNSAAPASGNAEAGPLTAPASRSAAHHPLLRWTGTVVQRSAGPRAAGLGGRLGALPGRGRPKRGHVGHRPRVTGGHSRGCGRPAGLPDGRRAAAGGHASGAASRGVAGPRGVGKNSVIDPAGLFRQNPSLNRRAVRVRHGLMASEAAS